MRKFCGLSLLFALMVMGCGRPPTTATTDDVTTSVVATKTPTSVSDSFLITPATSNAIGVIDWVNFIKFNDITYVAGDNPGRTLTEADLGPEFAKVRSKLADTVGDPSYRSQNSDAAFLEAGTPVFAIKGYAPNVMLAAHLQDRLVLYQADTNPAAKRGGDLLDLDGKVTFISINSMQDGTTEQGTIKDPDRVAKLVRLILQAPVSQTPIVQLGDGPGFVIAFHLINGLVLTRVYGTGSGELQRGIMLPQAFADEVVLAIGTHRTPVP
ncbi:MAG: hypothetical protein H0X37_02500 [Herpetosiphonaceae bacterium]|nr:hypothetical protein [Herpetosiphonaceae bacterium]